MLRKVVALPVVLALAAVGAAVGAGVGGLLTFALVFNNLREEEKRK